MYYKKWAFTRIFAVHFCAVSFWPGACSVSGSATGVAAEWRRAHQQEDAAEYEFWSTKEAEQVEQKAEHEELREEKRALKAAAEATYAAVEAGEYEFWTDTDVDTSSDDED